MPQFEPITVSLPDGEQAYGQYWHVAKPRGAVLYHHGIQSHCSWYDASAACLNNAGYSVLQIDRRGSGRNENNRGHAESADQLIEDALAARDELLRRCGLSSYAVVGVSWGGKLAVAAYIADPKGVQSLSLVTPGIFPKVGVSKSVMAKIGFAMLYEPRKSFPIPLDDPAFFTADPTWQKYIATDPMTLRQCTANFYLASRRMDKAIAKLLQSPPVPIHLLLAADERIIENEKTAAFVRKLKWPATRITQYDDARHSLEFEGDPQIYYRDLVAFINECANAEPVIAR